MGADADHHAMIEACITAAEHVNRTGSPKLQNVMRLLLYLIARETIEQDAGSRQAG